MRATARAKGIESVPFTWHGLAFTPEGSLGPGFYRTERVALGDLRSSDWKVQCIGDGAERRWHARLRIGADRFPGKGTTAEEALEAAAAEARLVAGYIRRLLPGSLPAPKGIRTRRARKGAE